MIGIDHFKGVNDWFDHRVGDQALKALAVRAGETLRDGDTLGRWGGEEFVIVLPEAELDEALHKAHALCAHVSGAPRVNDQWVSIGCGVTRVVSADTARACSIAPAWHAARQHERNRAESMAVA